MIAEPQIPITPQLPAPSETAVSVSIQNVEPLIQVSVRFQQVLFDPPRGKVIAVQFTAGSLAIALDDCCNDLLGRARTDDPQESGHLTVTRLAEAIMEALPIKQLTALVPLINHKGLREMLEAQFSKAYHSATPADWRDIR